MQYILEICINSYYALAYAKGMEEALNSVHAEYKYHVHTDECYGTRTLACTITPIFNNYFQHDCSCGSNRTFANYTLRHSSCGLGDVDNNYCTAHATLPSTSTHSYSAKVLVCGKTEETIEEVTIRMD